jgi:hypothetical protein
MLIKDGWSLLGYFEHFLVRFPPWQHYCSQNKLQLTSNSHMHQIKLFSVGENNKAGTLTLPRHIKFKEQRHPRPQTQSLQGSVLLTISNTHQTQAKTAPIGKQTTPLHSELSIVPISKTSKVIAQLQPLEKDNFILYANELG